MTSPNDISFTGIVVTFNEARRLRECLESMAFCEQIIVIDLGSRDGSVHVARECGAEIVHHERVPAVEYVWPEAVLLARNDWIVLVDPDEILPVSMHGDLLQAISGADGAGLVRVPYQYYFQGKPLSSSHWGGARFLARALHRKRVDLAACVHRGLALREGYETVRVEHSGANVVRHYWIDTLKQLFQKHRRYVLLEGASRYSSGERFTWASWVGQTLRALKHGLVQRRGLLGGPTGIFLSLFYAGYICMSVLSLRRYQRAAQRKPTGRPAPAPERKGA